MVNDQLTVFFRGLFPQYEGGTSGSLQEGGSKRDDSLPVLDETLGNDHPLLHVCFLSPSQTEPSHVPGFQIGEARFVGLAYVVHGPGPDFFRRLQLPRQDPVVPRGFYLSLGLLEFPLHRLKVFFHQVGAVGRLFFFPQSAQLGIQTLVFRVPLFGVGGHQPVAEVLEMYRMTCPDGRHRLVVDEVTGVDPLLYPTALFCVHFQKDLDGFESGLGSFFCPFVYNSRRERWRASPRKVLALYSYFVDRQ